MGGLAAKSVELAARPNLILWTFVTTLFASALLLFSVQPMFAKMALPLLGGTPAVWAVSMCFFQAALLAGYCYAHTLNRYLDPGRAVLFHIALLAVTILTLPIGLPDSLGEPPAGDAYLWLLSVLAVGVGLPFFAVSATAPLLQAWFARTGHKEAADPYFLYGASNAGSLIALIGYPLVLEPTLGLSAQSMAWGGGIAVLTLMIAACGALMLKSLTAPQTQALHPQSPAEDAGPAPSVSSNQRLTWVILAAIPSALMTAVTTYVTTDIASAPFLWVVPLSLYLLTFILTFRERLPVPYIAVQAILPVISLSVVMLSLRLWSAPLAALSFLLATIVCHRELYLRRPSAVHLTEFYIWMSVGGVIGGIFSALIAPQIFTTVLEFKLLTVLALLCIPGILSKTDAPIDVRRFALAATTILTVCFAFSWLVEERIADAYGPVLYAVVAAMMLGLFIVRTWPESKALGIIALLAWVAVMPHDRIVLHQERSFFGTNRVVISKDGQQHVMLHGTTMHGTERIMTPDGAVVTVPEPALYYHRQGPMARSIELARSRGGTPFSAGIVGLGTGSLACYARPADHWRFYEIDPMVARIARDPKLFTFLSKCQPNADIVIGDARLTLQKEQRASFDHLLIDAFSSDAIPAHLMTREALAMYFEKLKPDGLLAIHISNRYLDLGPIVASTAATLPGVHAAEVVWVPPADAPDASASTVFILTRDSTALKKVMTWPGAQSRPSKTVTPWSDDFTNVLGALLARISS